MWENTVIIYNILKKKIIKRNFNQLNIKKSKIDKDNLKKKSNFRKKRKIIKTITL